MQPHATAMGIAPTATMPATATARGGYAVAPQAPIPQQRMADPAESINLEEFYSTMEQVPPAALGATPPPMPVPQQPGAEWTPAERPIIRPQSAGATSAPMVRRAPQVQSPRPPADELGVEESEFDKPTYLRRGLFAPE
jgi:hypothetical protein